MTRTHRSKTPPKVFLDRGIPTDLRGALDRCPFRTLVGAKPAAPGNAATAMLPKIEHVFAVLGDSPMPITPEAMVEIVKCVQRGGTVLLISDRRDLRDRAKAEIGAMLDLTIGVGA